MEHARGRPVPGARSSSRPPNAPSRPSCAAPKKAVDGAGQPRRPACPRVARRQPLPPSATCPIAGLRHAEQHHPASPRRTTLRWPWPFPGRDFTRIAASDPKMWRDILRVQPRRADWRQSQLFQTGAATSGWRTPCLRQQRPTLEDLITLARGPPAPTGAGVGPAALPAARTPDVCHPISRPALPLAAARLATCLPGSKSISNRVLLLAA